jgi:hypothetical protein
MALTWTIEARLRVEPGDHGRWEGENKVLLFGTVAFDSSYPTNGEAVVAADLGANGTNAAIDMLMVTNGETGYVYSWDKSAAKIKAFEAGADGAALDEVGNTTDISADAAVAFTALVTLGS